MPKTSKRHAAASAGVPTGAKLAPDEAVKLVKELASAKFDESVDVSTRLDVDPRKADQLVRGTVVLPHGTGKSVRVLVIAQGEKEAEAEGRRSGLHRSRVRREDPSRLAGLRRLCRHSGPHG